MAYTPYQPTWQNPYLQQVMGNPVNLPYVQQPQNGIVKVNGRDSAMQYQLPPNSTSPALFDNNGKVFYVVSTDGTGTKTIEVFDFSPHVDEEPVKVDGAEFVSKREYDEFVAKVDAALGALNGTDGSAQGKHAARPSGQDERAQVDGQRQPQRVAPTPSED